MRMNINLATTFYWMLVSHAACDYPLQGDFLARGKNHRAPLAGVPWWICLTAHSLIHAGGVSLATGSVAIGTSEFFLHCLIDYGKCEGWYDFELDQALHIGCKIAWIQVLATGVL